MYLTFDFSAGVLSEKLLAKVFRETFSLKFEMA